MRLNEFERETIRRVTHEVAGARAQALLFGSRVQDELKGGDIDLLIELPDPGQDRFQLALDIGVRLDRALGLRKIDVLVADPSSPQEPVLIAARRTGQPV